MYIRFQATVTYKMSLSFINYLALEAHLIKQMILDIFLVTEDGMRLQYQFKMNDNNIITSNSPGQRVNNSTS